MFAVFSWILKKHAFDTVDHSICKKNWKTMLLEEYQTNGVLSILIADTKL